MLVFALLAVAVLPSAQSLQSPVQLFDAKQPQPPIVKTLLLASLLTPTPTSGEVSATPTLDVESGVETPIPLMTILPNPTPTPEHEVVQTLFSTPTPEIEIASPTTSE